ncbi:MAG TPA: hypothetical protein VJN96_22080 [Vicinamibacterales bacterium]|nr:hypothetical protein [Vicinamibacterales bacterium]
MKRRSAGPSLLVALGLVGCACWSLAAQAPAPGCSRAKAPFKVVDAAGNAIFEVGTTAVTDDKGKPAGSTRFFRLDNAEGKPVAFASATPDGKAFLKAMTPDEKTQVVMGVTGAKDALVDLRYDGPSKDRASLSVIRGQPALYMYNDDFKNIVELSQASSGGGHLLINNAKGEPMVEAGVTPTGVGFVQALPKGNPGVTMLGLPGTFIVGRGAAGGGGGGR